MGRGSWHDKLPGGEADERDPSEFDQDELSMGVEDELEHTDDELTAAEIAMDHLTGDPKYYSKLDEVGGSSGWDDESFPGPISKINNNEENDPKLLGQFLETLKIDVERYVARGAFGYVFIGSPTSGPLSGRKMAIKVSGEKDAKQYSAAVKAVERLPSRVAKHLPRVYGVTVMPWPETELLKGFVGNSGVIQGEPISIIAMEILRPLPQELRDTMFRNIMYSPKAAKFVTADPARIIELIRFAARLYNAGLQRGAHVPDPPGAKQLYSKKYEVSNADLKRVEALIMRGNRPETARFRAALDISDEDTAPPILDVAAQAAAAVAELFAGDPHHRTAGLQFADDVINTFRSDSGAAFRSMPAHKQSPDAYRVPGVAPLMHAIQVMKHSGIRWSDVHEDNVMVRPATGDLVIADIGFFDFPGAY